MKAEGIRNHIHLDAFPDMVIIILIRIVNHQGDVIIGIINAYVKRLNVLNVQSIHLIIIQILVMHHHVYHAQHQNLQPILQLGINRLMHVFE